MSASFWPAPSLLLKCENCRLQQTRLITMSGVGLCAHCAVREINLGDRDSLETVLPLVMEKHICAYCGEYGEEVEHVVPRCSHLPTWTVRACRECNGAASGYTFPSFAAKRSYIRGRLRRRYAKYLRMPEWTEDEYEGLADHLAKTIRASNQMRGWVLQRLQFDLAIDELAETLEGETLEKPRKKTVPKVREVVLNRPVRPEVLQRKVPDGNVAGDAGSRVPELRDGPPPKPFIRRVVDWFLSP